MKEEWRKQMQQKMADYEESDIDLSWKEIEKALEANRQKALEADKREARTIPLWQRRAAAAAVILLLAGVGYLVLQRQTPEVIKTDTMQTVADKAVPPAESLEKEQRPSSTLPKKIMVNASRPMTLASVVFCSQNAATESGGQDHDSDSVSNQLTCPPDTAPSAEKTREKVTNKPQRQATVIYPSDLRAKSTSVNRLTAKVFFSNAITGYSGLMSSNQQSPFSSNKYTPQTNPLTSDVGENNYYVYPPDKNGTEKANDGDGTDDAGESLQYHTQQKDETTHHHQPIRFGFSLRYRMNDRWSIESGLTYTRLSSDFTMTVDGQSTTIEQYLTYVGIPVNVSYRLWGSRYLNVYVSAGGMVEKMVKGSLQTSNTATSVSIHPLQFSLNSAIGAEFNISRQFSLYAEPGLGYWFDNGSSVSTYYQDKPLSFILNFGIRLNPW